MTKTVYHKNKTISYDLEERTLKFAQDVRIFVKDVHKSIVNFDDLKQIIRASGSVGANYIEANEALSKKDFIHRIKICRKESKECTYWFKVIDIGNDAILNDRKNKLQNEAFELMLIFGAIIQKSQ